MIKGVNKQILEVTNTDSPYFEKIIFFVRPESQKLDEQKLRSEAVKLSKIKAKPPRQRRTMRQIISTMLYSMLGVGAGVGTMILINYIIK